MKYVLLVIFLLLVGLSAAAWWATPRADESGRKTLVWGSDDNPRRRVQIDMFNTLHPDYQLTLDTQSFDLDKVVVQSLAGMGPEVFDSSRHALGILLEAGMLYDITDDLAKRGITLDQFWPLSQACMSINGRIYGVACNVEANGLWFHRDIFRAEGIEEPPASGWTWDQFLQTAKKLTKRDANGRIIRYGIMGYKWQDLMYTNGGRQFTPDGRKCIVDSPENVDAVQKWMDLQFLHKVMPSPIDEASMSNQGGWSGEFFNYFKDKRTAMNVGNRWWLCQMRMLRDAQGKFPLDLGAAECPVTKYRRFRGWSRVAYVNALSPRRERAVEFLAFLASKPYTDQINLDADALPSLIKAADDPSYYNDPYQGKDASASPAWKSATQHAIPVEISPYITVNGTNKLIDRQIDLVRNRIKTPEEGLRQAAADVNAEIARNIQREPNLKKQYDSSDGRPVLGNTE